LLVYLIIHAPQGWQGCADEACQLKLTRIPPQDSQASLEIFIEKRRTLNI